jgi:hypothetical protein
MFLNIKVVVQHAVTHAIGLYKHVFAANLIEATLETQITHDQPALYNKSLLFRYAPLSFCLRPWYLLC